MVPKLSDAQAALLAAAAARSDRSILPAPETPRLKGAALERTLKALLGRGLITLAPVLVSTSAEPDEEAGDDKRLLITPAGLEALGAESGHSEGLVTDATPERRQQPNTRAARPSGKLGLLLDAVSRPDGATLDELTAAASWLPHTTRAAISRLRQRGYDVRIARVSTRKAYHLVPAV